MAEIRWTQQASSDLEGITSFKAGLMNILAIILFLHLRQQFISIMGDLRDSPECFLIFPFQLGASSAGAVLLVLAWYYVHPLAWLRPDATTKRAISASFTPMLLTMGILAVMMVFSIFMMLT